MKIVYKTDFLCDILQRQDIFPPSSKTTYSALKCVDYFRCDTYENLKPNYNPFDTLKIVVPIKIVVFYGLFYFIPVRGYSEGRIISYKTQLLSHNRQKTCFKYKLETVLRAIMKDTCIDAAVLGRIYKKNELTSVKDVSSQYCH